MIGRAALLAFLLALAGGLFLRRMWFLYQLNALGRPVARTDDLPKRVTREGSHVLGQRKLFQRFVPGLMHALIFWGFLVLLTTIAEAIGQAVSLDFALPLIGHSAWLGLVQDVFAGGVLVGLAIAMWIRLAQRPERFIGSHMTEAYRILGLIFWIIVTLFGLNAARIANGLAESPTAWTPISTAASHLFTWMGPGLQRFFVWSFLWAHLVLVLVFLVYLGYSKHLHIITAAANVFFASTKARGALTPLKIDMESLEAGTQSLGAEAITDLTRKELLDLTACTECGRCQSACPAWNTGKPLSPKLLVMNLRDHLFEEGPEILRAQANGTEHEKHALVPDVIDDEVVWACTTCGACVQECPVDIEHIDTIIDLRRHLVMGESRFPAEAGTLMRNLEGQGNPWGLPQAQRASWAEGLDVPIVNGTAPEYVYWVGCAGSFDDRAKKISRAVAELLQQAGVSFAILGPREMCTGDPARRMGNEFLFQTLAEQNVETMNGAGVTKVIANCPHCFNTLRNEYPEYGGTYQVIHHTELLADLVATGRLKPTEEVRSQVAYHDPCYLGRHNEIYDPPRRVLEGVPGIEQIEMPRHRERGLCCGAGGARMWMEERIGKRINRERMDEAASTGADTVGVACPYCLIMLDDGARDRGGELEVLDVAQLVRRSVSDARPSLRPSTSHSD
ncbi:MAG TPA: heterodisulfide reductase-related iron-sulfur binding cluster [Actinomycetota bacterium]|nr:heterodisulfide reductase-related iron-sulfur binding cluster [Actinomycetota bacterium]